MPTERGLDEMPTAQLGSSKTPLTIGLAVTLFGAVVGIVSWTLRTQDATKEIAREVLTIHTQVAPEIAHPGLADYVKVQDLKDSVNEMKWHVAREQKQTTNEIKELIEKMNIQNNRRERR
jgi:HAMP domain-containing protein